MRRLPMHWLKSLKTRVRFKEPLKRHTSLGVGGPARVWVEPESYLKLKEIVYGCRKRKIPYLVIGKGSNILFSERGFNGVIICLNSSAFTGMDVEGAYLSCGAGLSLNKLIRKTQRIGLGGLEFLSGIPGTVGGALIMNAGSMTASIGNLVRSVTVMNGDGKIRILEKERLKFGYRWSNLNGYIVLKVQFALVRRDPQRIGLNITKFLEQKKRNQDLNAKSAGCIFKNPPQGLTAGEMIERCGLKQRRRGDAEISSRHANYIINRNSAKAGDILYLINLARRQVERKFGVILENEIKIIK